MRTKSTTLQFAWGAFVLAVILAVGGLTASAETGKKPGTAAKRAPSEAAPPDKAKAVPVSDNSDEVTLLKQQLALQQKQIERLSLALEDQKRMLEQVLQNSQASTQQAPNLGQVASLQREVPRGQAESQTQAATLALPAARAGGADPVTQEQMQGFTKKVDQLEKSVGSIGKGLGNFNMSGDVRVRYENFIQDQTQTRNRQRIRARLNLKGKISDDMFGGISVASGDLNDPISTNQTLTSFYQRKTIGIDQAYLTINPKAFRALTVTGGKQVYPWYRTQLTFDSDLNPEGFSEALSLNSKSFLKNVTVMGFQLPFNEVGSGRDGALYGGQLQLKFNAGEKGTFELYGGGIKFSRPDSIAVAQSKGTVANSLTNTVVKDANGNVTGYAGQFLYFNAAVRAGYKMAPRWPFNVGLDFVQNTQAATDQRKGYLAEASIGQEVNPKDVKFGYQYYRIEKDAVISAFNFSDLRTATNVQNHVFFVGYQIIKNVSGEWTYLLGKRLNDPTDKWLSRMQFDLVYKF